MATVLEFQRQLLRDPQARAEFAANPKKFLSDNGITIPAGLKLPAKLDKELVEERINQVEAAAKEEGLSVDNLSLDNTRAVTNFLAEAVPARNKELAVAEGVHATLIGRDRNATVAVVGAVVAAVVAVPVAVYGVADDFVQRSLPATGIRKVTRGAGGLSIEGPGGLQVHGLSVNEVAELIRELR